MNLGLPGSEVQSSSLGEDPDEEEDEDVVAVLLWSWAAAAGDDDGRGASGVSLAASIASALPRERPSVGESDAL